MPKEYLDKAGLKRLIELLKAELTKLESYTDNAVSQLRDEIENLESIAKGAVGGETFMTYEELVNELNAADNTAFYQGQHMLIKTIGVPDVWVYEVSDTNVPYTYTDDETLVKAVTETTVQVGYYVLSALETQKVIVDELVKVTDYITSTKAGIVADSVNYGFRSIADKGVVGGVSRTKEQYDTVSPYFFISKGTLENIKNAYVKESITTSTETWTDDEKAAACETIGAFPNVSESVTGDCFVPVYNKNTDEYGYKNAFATYFGGGYTLMLRDSKGFSHGKTATAESAGTVLINKEYVETNFVPKKVTSGLMKVYGNDTNGEVTMFTIRQPGQATADAHIPQTDANGVLHAATPAADANGTALITKGYIDGWELINKITLTEEAKRIRCEADSDGNEFLLKKVVFIVRSQPSTEATESATLYYCVSMMTNRAASSTVHQVGELGAGIRTTAQQNVAYVEQACYIPSGRAEGQGVTILSISGGENGTLKPKYLLRDFKPATEEQHITCAYVESGSDTTIFGVGSELEIWGVRA